MKFITKRYYSVPQRFVVFGEISCSTNIRGFLIPSFYEFLQAIKIVRNCSLPAGA